MSSANKKKETVRKKRSFARGVNTLLSGRFLTREYVQQNLPFIFFVVAVMVCYIGYGYFAEKNVKDLVEAEAHLREIKSQNLSIHARLEQLKQQSQVAESIRDLGLVESTTPPTLIRIPDSDND
jgi:hypothetical protein